MSRLRWPAVVSPPLETAATIAGRGTCNTPGGPPTINSRAIGQLTPSPPRAPARAIPAAQRCDRVSEVAFAATLATVADTTVITVTSVSGVSVALPDEPAVIPSLEATPPPTATTGLHVSSPALHLGAVDTINSLAIKHHGARRHRPDQLPKKGAAASVSVGTGDAGAL